MLPEAKCDNYSDQKVIAPHFGQIEYATRI